jgi:hypothetical protein
MFMWLHVHDESFGVKKCVRVEALELGARWKRSDNRHVEIYVFRSNKIF